jgi:prepilin-type N-terminal cleavage/methylation domain-containing protein
VCLFAGSRVSCTFLQSEAGWKPIGETVTLDCNWALEKKSQMEKLPTLFRSRTGFTLVELMIVVAIIGLLVAIAIPGYQKIRQSAVGKVMDNDARQLGQAAQQYFSEYSVTTVSLTYAAGTIGGPLSVYVKRISSTYPDSGVPNSLTVTDDFSMSHNLLPAPCVYSADGQHK